MPMMQNWKSRVLRKLKFANGGNTQKKGKNCQTDPMKKFFFTSPKAYLHRDYAKWHTRAVKLQG